jgi:hypothetical protein
MSVPSGGATTPPSASSPASAGPSVTDVWASDGTAMAALLELMVLKAITSVTIGPAGPQQWKVIASPEDTTSLLTRTPEQFTFDSLVQGALPVEETFLRHLSRGLTRHEATVELAGRVFVFQVALNWAAQTADVMAANPLHPAIRDR